MIGRGAWREAEELFNMVTSWAGGVYLTKETSTVVSLSAIINSEKIKVA